MPKLLIINITCNQGSTGKISEQVGLMMKERGWDVYYAHGARRVNPSQLKTIPFSSVRVEYLHALKSLLFDADGLRSTKATKRLVDQIKEIHPDVIQIHNIHGYYLNYKVLFEYLNSTDIPVVITLHDCWNFTGHCTHFVTANCEKWKTGCGNCPQIHSVPKSLFLDRSKRNFHLKKKYIGGNRNLHIVCVSKWLEHFLYQSMYKEHPVHLIHNGIDLNVYHTYVEKKRSKFCILGVGNPWSKNKGLYDIYELRNLLPMDEYAITLVGLNRKQIKALPMGINGILHTNNQQELADLYSASDVFINPTYADTFPTTNLESLACGTPVITYNTCGSPESLTPETGAVVDQGDVNALCTKIQEFKTLDFKQLHSADCRKYAEEHFNKDKCFEKYIELYESLIV